MDYALRLRPYFETLPYYLKHVLPLMGVLVFDNVHVIKLVWFVYLQFSKMMSDESFTDILIATETKVFKVLFKLP